MKAQDDKIIQTLPWNSEGHTSQRSSVSSPAPEHFSVEQLNKLESRFTHQKWPDREGLIIIAMECNLLVEDVEVCQVLHLFNSHFHHLIVQISPNHTNFHRIIALLIIL